VAGLTAASCTTATEPRNEFPLDWSASVSTPEVLYLDPKPWGWWGEIDFAVSNPMEETLSIPHCNGGFVYRLEGWIEGEWTTAWGPMVELCAGGLYEIEPGETLEFTRPIHGGHPEGSLGTRFPSSDPEGYYRLVVEALYRDYDSQSPEMGEQVPLEYRVSHVFRIRVRD